MHSVKSVWLSSWRNEAALLWAVLQPFVAETELDTGEDRMSQRMRRNQKIRTD